MGFDRRYARPAYIVMQSVMDTVAPQRFVSFKVLHEGLPEEVMRVGRLLFNQGRSTIEFIDVRERMATMEMFTTRHLSRAMFYRLMIPELFSDHDGVLYLDSDMVAMRDVFDMVEEVPADKKLAAVRDGISKIDRLHGAHMRELMDAGPDDLLALSLEDYKRQVIGLDDPDRYFNSGTLFLRPSKITPEEIEACFKLVDAPRYCPDQDILNAVFKDSTHLLGERWNFVTGSRWEGYFRELPEDWRKEREEERKQVGIYHWPGPVKPWRIPGTSNAEAYHHFAKSLDAHLQRIAEPYFNELLPV
ncbi:hypothetical protein E3E12_03110 [Formicincola oecophyllae]|uniref:Glycosyltransferase family 8 protein n=1 Tax=Formicincola oecophyllae TaxID=2558361 RepID=A0A4Y6UA69_9PROT|nr:glycosyltransferase [Formicincola oecophyllae]QDH13356.1 hypothetical protein E3E12_03110 [Formicincola oecophyllae]